MSYYETGEIDTIIDLNMAVQDCVTGGYDVDYIVKGRNKSGFLIIEVSTNEPLEVYIPGLCGQFWFYDSGEVMQVI